MAQRASSEPLHQKTRKGAMRLSTDRWWDTRPRDPHAPGQAERALNHRHPPRAPRAFQGTTARAGINGEGEGVACPRPANEPRRGAGGRSWSIEHLLASWPPVCRCRGVTCQGPGRLPVGGQRGAGKGARAPRLAGAGGGGFLSVRATRWPRWQLRTSARRPWEPQPPPPAPPLRGPERYPGHPRRP